MIFLASVTGRVDDAIGVLEHHNGHFECDAHETCGHDIKSMTFQVGPDWHVSAVATKGPRRN